MPLARSLGAEWFEVPLEDTTLIDYERAGQVIRDHGMGVSVCAAMGPDRDLIHPDAAIRDSGMAYLKHCVDAVRKLGGTNVAGPLYSSVGRVWQATDDERRRDTDLLVQQLSDLAAYAGDRGGAVHRAAQPLGKLTNLAAQATGGGPRRSRPAASCSTPSMNIEERSLGAAIHAVGPRLAHVHACGNRGAPGSATSRGATSRRRSRRSATTARW